MNDPEANYSRLSVLQHAFADDPNNLKTIEFVFDLIRTPDIRKDLIKQYGILNLFAEMKTFAEFHGKKPLEVIASQIL
jgi:hypothetical protein